MLPSGLPEQVGDEELLVRFARHKDYKASTLQAKGDMFIPPKNSSKLSVSRVSTLSIAAIKMMGHHVIEQKPGDSLKGWVIIETHRVRSIRSFDVDPDEEDGNRLYHAHIQHFPSDKSELMEAADDLAEASSFVTVVSPTK